MRVRNKKVLMLAVGAVGFQIAPLLHAATNNYTWEGTTSNDATDPSNWTPSLPDYDNSSSAGTVLVFDASSSLINTSPNLPLGAPGTAGGGIANIDEILYNAGAPAETWTGTGYLQPQNNNFSSIENDSSNTQTFDLDVGAYATGTSSSHVNANNADIVINGTFHPGTDLSGHSATVGGSHDVYLHQIEIAGGGGSLDAQVLYNGSGHLFLADSNGTGSYNGNIIEQSTTGGLIVATNANSFGTNVGVTTISGNTTGNGAIELATGVGNSASFGETFIFVTRTGAVANAPHLVNVSGNNTITADISYFTSTAGNNLNIVSQGTAPGDLLTYSGNFVHDSPGNQNLVLSGAGNGIISGAIATTSGSWDIVKQGAGQWSLTNSTNNVNGTTTIQGGTLSLGTTGTLITNTIGVQAGTTFDVSGLSGGYQLTGSQILKGAGTVTGNPHRRRKLHHRSRRHCRHRRGNVDRLRQPFPHRWRHDCHEVEQQPGERK